MGGRIHGLEIDAFNVAEAISLFFMDEPPKNHVSYLIL